jgi:hypothetical protein
MKKMINIRRSEDEVFYKNICFVFTGDRNMDVTFAVKNQKLRTKSSIPPI